MTPAMSAYILAAFLLVQGIIMLWIVGQASIAPIEPGQKKRISVFEKTGLFLGLFYVLLSQIALWAALTSSYVHFNDAACENVVRNTTVIDNTTAYEYENTCAGREISGSARILMIIWTNYLYLLFAISIVSLIYLAIRGIKQW